MDTTLTSGHMQSILRLLDEKKAHPDRVTKVLASGILADVFDHDADLSSRDAVRAGLKLPPLAPPPVQPKPALVLLRSVALPALPAENTAKCLEGPHYYSGRDRDINEWLPKMQPACDSGKIGVIERMANHTFADMFRATLKLPPGVPLDEIARFLKEGKHVLGLQQVDALVDKQEEGEDVGLRTDGWGNLIPILDKDGNVCVLRVYRGVGSWYRSVSRLARGNVWGSGGRLVLGNSDALSL